MKKVTTILLGILVFVMSAATLQMIGVHTYINAYVTWCIIMGYSYLINRKTSEKMREEILSVYRERAQENIEHRKEYNMILKASQNTKFAFFLFVFALPPIVFLLDYFNFPYLIYIPLGVCFGLFIIWIIKRSISI